MYICHACLKKSERSEICCGRYMSPVCEHIGCEKPASHVVYGFGYLASVCDEHYKNSSASDKECAITFRYAE